jgi:hypothetical protein
MAIGRQGNLSVISIQCLQVIRLILNDAESNETEITTSIRFSHLVLRFFVK